VVTFRPTRPPPAGPVQVHEIDQSHAQISAPTVAVATTYGRGDNSSVNGQMGLSRTHLDA